MKKKKIQMTNQVSQIFYSLSLISNAGVFIYASNNFPGTRFITIFTKNNKFIFNSSDE